MFNLIVAVISIALIAAMAAASIFYGGEAFSNSTAKAQASTLVNNGQQISGAQQLYMIDNSGVRATDIATFTADPFYLQALPTPPASVVADNEVWALADSGAIAFIDLVDANAAAVCDSIEESGGLSSAVTANASTPLASELTGDAQFGCLETAGGDIIFAYKL
jgi:hypothetical protein